MTQREILEQWLEVEAYFAQLTGRVPDLNGILFLIGVQELGQGVRHFSKEQKQDLMHIAVCRVLSFSGYYELEGLDQDGWPHWRLVRPLPHFDLVSQEQFLKAHIIAYFQQNINPV